MYDRLTMTKLVRSAECESVLGLRTPGFTRDREANQNVAPTDADFPEPADLLNQLKGRRKKSRADLADMEAVLDLLGDRD
ncbi:hypothetical protein [Tychonema sp. LEGE 06208]|uniref:hypothetical protein n=1 Tax=Tychonema sp. LEGE 06208 TaxID=1828663 RepID=UPI001D142C0F|nr:hypothetical protein [Tychonema sp. LEGE 06208]